MIIVIDIGNSNTTCAYMKEDKIIRKMKILTVINRTSDEYTVFFESFLRQGKVSPEDIQDIVICSVVPDAVLEISRAWSQLTGRKVIVVGEDIYPDMKILIDNPGELGHDRLAASYAAVKLYSPPALIIDFGTAITFDAVSREGSYLGGVIIPGLHISLAALHNKTAKLPRVLPRKMNQVIGKNTTSSIQSGIYHGYSSMIEGLVIKFAQEFEYDKIIYTGGIVDTIDLPSLRNSLINTDLVLFGIYFVYKDCISP